MRACDAEEYIPCIASVATDDLLAQSRRSGCRSLLYSDYVGPLTEKWISAEKGRGLVATTAIEAGELVLGCKALDIIFPGDLASDSGANAQTALDGFASTLLAERLSERSRNDASVMHALLSMYHGSPAASSCMELSSADIQRICMYNAFGCGPIPTVNGTAPLRDGNAHPSHVIGLWVLPARINHDCIGNCVWYTISDFLFVRAYKQIDVGCELLMPYNPPSDSFEDRRKETDRMGFECSCSLCLDDQLFIKSSHYEAYGHVLDELEGLHVATVLETAALTGNSHSIANLSQQLTGCIQRIEELFKERVWHQALCVPCTVLGNLELRLGNTEAAVEAYQKAYEACWKRDGSQSFVQHHLLVAVMNMARALAKGKQQHSVLASWWAERAEHALRQCYGVDSSFFQCHLQKRPTRIVQLESPHAAMVSSTSTSTLHQ